jgi:putative transcriptional regulator
MRKKIKESLKSSIQGILDAGFGISFTEAELKKLGVKIPSISITPEKIQKIRNKMNYSQPVFARLLNVSPSSVKQWEQGDRRPTGPTTVLIDLLGRNPHILDYRLTKEKSH